MTGVAVIGLGAMGAGMAHRLLGRGFEVTVYNRTAARAAPLTAAGARQAGTAADAARAARVLLLSLSDERAVDQVLFGETGAAPPPGSLVVDTSTVSPSYARQAAQRLAGLGARRVEACVLGNPDMAREGALRVFTAGDPEPAEAVLDVLAALAAQVLHVGPAGSASALKLVFSALLGTQVAALAEAVNYGTEAGLDPALLLTAVEHSGFSSRVLAFRAAFMRERRYEPAAFRAWLMEKDLRLTLGEASQLGVPMPVTVSAADRFAAAVSAGDGDKDAAVVVESHGGRQLSASATSAP
jgi:3-hydroxyisobutyrate dehydrogenase-like beta-hydroxyacid dehydrogenase